MKLKHALTLTRPKICIAVCAATVLGGWLNTPSPGWALAWAAAGSLLLCAGCSALNQWQERATDALMRRTRVRPLPSGTVRPQAALLFATGCFASGIGLYAYAAGWPLVVTGLTVVFIYNGLYTPLKPVTSLSLLLGGIAGALPPMVGWLAVGGSPTAPPAAAFCTALYLWQVPHFWSIADQHREDYRAAGLAMPSDGLPSESLSRIRTLWMAATLVALALAVVFLYNDFIPHHPMLPA